MNGSHKKRQPSTAEKKIRLTPGVLTITGRSIRAVKTGTANWRQIAFLRRYADQLNLAPDFRKLLYPQSKPEVMPADGAAGYTPGRRRAAGTIQRA